MEFTIKTGAPEKLKAGCLVVGAFAGGMLTDAAAALDKAAKGKLAALIARGDLDEKAGSLLALHELPGCAAERVLVVSLGKQEELADRAWRDAVGAVAKALAASPTHDAAVCLADIELPGRDAEWALQQLARALADGTYRYDATKSKKKDDKPRGARKVVLATRNKISAAMEAAVKRGQAIAEGMALAKDLGNLPGNYCTPTHLAETAVELGKQFKLKVEVLEREDMEKLGMGSLLSVARGSHQPPKFIVLHYKGGKAKDKPVVLVGKGITFDTGGISLKPAEIGRAHV